MLLSTHNMSDAHKGVVHCVLHRSMDDVISKPQTKSGVRRQALHDRIVARWQRMVMPTTIWQIFPVIVMNETLSYQLRQRLAMRAWWVDEGRYQTPRGTLLTSHAEVVHRHPCRAQKDKVAYCGLGVPRHFPAHQIFDCNTLQ